MRTTLLTICLLMLFKLVLSAQTECKCEKIFDQVLFGHAQQLMSAKKLIIDIRGNSGGNGVYFDLLRLFAKEPIQSEVGYALSSKANINYFETFSQKRSDKIYTPVLMDMENNPGSIVDGPRYLPITLEPLPSQVQHVVILTDNANMSAAESFILHAKGSNQAIKTIGVKTKGVIDYLSVHTVSIGCEKIGVRFGYPTSTLNKQVLNNGYNKSGILPDVPSENSGPELVRFAMEYLANEL